MTLDLVVDPLDKTPKTWTKEKKIDTLDSIKVENFCTSKCVVRNSYIM